jgi:ribonuclease T1
LVTLALAAGSAAGCAREEQTHDFLAIAASELPAEARQTLERIDRGGPFPYARDGSVFFNREGLLPPARRGYYREFTVPTPGSADRGPRRIVQGGGGELYYTEDHYRTFKRVRR